ncbi:MAG: DUF11 domain-containing protein, partial [bacterium]|nr:DUF11 domain-containing protein [bacterium]
DSAGVVLSDTIPAHAAFDAAASDPGWSCDASTCTLSVGAVDAGAPAQSFTIAFVVDDPLAAGVDEIFNSAAAADDGASGPDLDASSNSASDSTPIDSGPGGTGPDLVLTKTDGGATAGAGGLITYSLTVGNVGNQDSTGVLLSDTIPAHAAFDAAASDPGWSCDAVVCTLSVGAVDVSVPAQSFTITFVVDDPLAAGVDEILNSA